MSFEDRVFALNKGQIRKINKVHIAKMKCMLNPDATVRIVLPEDLAENVVVVDDGGYHLGYLSVKDAWSL